MGLLKWMRLRKSDTKKDDFDASLPQLLRTVYSDLQLKNFAEARRLLLDALEHRDKIEDPVFVAYILSYLSWTWSSPSEYASAIRFFTDYIARYPNDAPAYHHRASTLWYSGQLAAAIDDYSLALKLSPTDILLLSARGQVLAECGECERALQDLDAALDYLRQNPYFGLSWATKARAYALNGRAAALSGLNRFDDSFKDFDRSIKLCPDNAWVYFNRAGARELKGDRDGAISDYRLALVKKDPPLCFYKKDKADARLRELGAS
jgi:tetratricopeptide (TPR) repeat protein